MCKAKTQISLGIHYDQTERMPRLIWVFAVRTLILLVLSCRGSNHFYGNFLLTVDFSGAVVSNWRKYVHLRLFYRLGGLQPVSNRNRCISHWRKKIEPYKSQWFVHTARETQTCEHTTEIYKTPSFSSMRLSHRSICETGLSLFRRRVNSLTDPWIMLTGLSPHPPVS